jgi:DNA mismatch repair protein MutL
VKKLEAPPEIRQLSRGVINKIAAGEVIERPASVLKELLENAVDAGADRIDVAIEKGGMDLVRVVDNGCGMRADQLPLAVASHATSKIESAEDLFNVTTMGFRGEALASISEVSQFTIRSRTADADAGHELSVEGGSVGNVVPCGCPVGTTVEVRNLFFNTPVRRKFLRSVQTELAHCTEAFTRIAMAFPAIHFTLRHHDRDVFELSSSDDWKTRIGALCGREISDGLIRIDSQDGPIRLFGYAGNPNLSRANNKTQYLFLNGRHIRDRSLQHALSEAYRGLILQGRFPIAFLQLEMPPDQIDVNVHPTKLEVRFQDGNRIYGQLLSALRTEFLSTDLTARVQPVVGAGSADADPESAVDPLQTAAIRDDFHRWAQGNPDTGPAAVETPPADHQNHLRFDPLHVHMPNPFGPTIPGFKPFDPVSPRRPFPQFPPDAESAARTTSPKFGDTRAIDPGPWTAGPAPRPAASNRAIQAHNRYIITESDEGIVVIDQHALHERILYEEIREKVLRGTLESQRLLVPETVNLTAPECAELLESQSMLANLGIEIEPFGGDTILISSYPAMLANINPGELIRQIAEQLSIPGRLPDRRDILDELLHMISCKAAIKAGDRLSAEEIQTLIERRHLVQDAHHCPHGRPTTLVFTREELDRRFKRT